MGMGIRTTFKGLEADRATLPTYERLQHKMEEFDRRFGQVLTCSVIWISPNNHRLDWGLFMEDEDRAGLNRISASVELLHHAALSQLVDIEVTETGPPELHEGVMMKGSTSHTRVGIVSRIQDNVDWPDLQWRTSEYVVTGSQGQAFADYGDSGAAVIDSEGRLCHPRK
ncbi:MAG: vacuolar membrane-associated protein iml1 [Watsoniomyces obsoletus]|nr:MAG: vacuolar membrane-associated protein iml1 [Watsoniomyces obsoletus]